MSLEGEHSKLARITSTQCSIKDSRSLKEEGVWDVYEHVRRRITIWRHG
jgi:hypothetical protein